MFNVFTNVFPQAVKKTLSDSWENKVHKKQFYKNNSTGGSVSEVWLYLHAKTY